MAIQQAIQESDGKLSQLAEAVQDEFLERDDVINKNNGTFDRRLNLLERWRRNQIMRQQAERRVVKLIPIAISLVALGLAVYAATPWP